MEYKCPARESSKYLCDRVAEYQINGTVLCNIHARRVLDGDDLTVRVREFEGKNHAALHAEQKRLPDVELPIGSEQGDAQMHHHRRRS